MGSGFRVRFRVPALWEPLAEAATAALVNGSEQVLPTLSLKLPECLTCRVKVPSGPEVTGRFAGSAGVVTAETIEPGRSMLDVSPAAEPVIVPVTVVVYLAAPTEGTEPPPQVVSSNAAGNRNNRIEKKKFFLSDRRLAAIFAGGGGG